MSKKYIRNYYHYAHVKSLKQLFNYIKLVSLSTCFYSPNDDFFISIDVFMDE